MSSKTVVCFGEVLWDILPNTKVAGGAPMNVCFHLANFGLQSRMISKVGNDELGSALLAFLNEKGIDTGLVQTDTKQRTGIVNVSFEGGGPSYEIVAPVAWDFIEINDKLLSEIRKADVLVYGSLATRNQTSRDTLLSLLGEVPFKVFDVNLRPPNYEKEILEILLAQADIVKMNDEELEIISGWYTESKDEIEQLKYLKKYFGFEGILMTKGKDGALYFNEEGLHVQSGFPVEKIADTIGSGDSFLAGFLSQFLQGKTPTECLAFACATGALVATHQGGTPSINERIVKDFIITS